MRGGSEYNDPTPIVTRYYPQKRPAMRQRRRRSLLLLACVGWAAQAADPPPTFSVPSQPATGRTSSTGRVLSSSSAPTPAPVTGVTSFTELEDAITDGAIINIETSAISVVTEPTIPNSNTVEVTSDIVTTLDGASSSRCFRVFGDLTLRSLRLVNGAASMESCSESNPVCRGGAIYVANSGVLTMDSCVVRVSQAHVSAWHRALSMFLHLNAVCLPKHSGAEQYTLPAQWSCPAQHFFLTRQPKG